MAIWMQPMPTHNPGSYTRSIQSQISHLANKPERTESVVDLRGLQAQFC